MLKLLGELLGQQDDLVCAVRGLEQLDGAEKLDKFDDVEELEELGGVLELEQLYVT